MSGVGNDLSAFRLGNSDFLSGFSISPKHSVEFFHLETEMIVDQLGLLSSLLYS